MNEQLRDLVNIDRTVHEPARRAILAILWAAESADFLYLLKPSSRGTLSSHLNKLEAAGYILIEKTFEGKIPRTPGHCECLDTHAQSRKKSVWGVLVGVYPHQNSPFSLLSGG